MENSGLGYTEFDIRRVIPGEAEDVRLRLAAVLEQFNYRVLNEQPLQARRSQQRNILAANSLDLTTKLTIGLKTLSQHATLATFDYAVQQVWTEGDKQTFEREADAIVALALATAARPTVCTACGAESAGDSRFCRSCGAPASRESLPAELEVMRLTADARAAHQEHVTGVLIMLLDLAIALPIILFGKPKLVNLGIGIFVIGQLLAWACLLYGMLRLHRTLNPKRPARDAEPRLPRAVPAPAQAQALPPASAHASITEGTTELLSTPRREKIEVPLRRADKTDTAPQ